MDKPKASARTSARTTAKKTNYVTPVVIFALGFAFAALLLHSSMGGGSVLEAAKTEAAARAKAGTITANDLRPFFDAVKKGDFPAMSSLGEKAFVAGRTVEAAEKTLAGYETTSYPPFTVYAFFIANSKDKTRRVLLTLDADGTVVSFLAEEMSVIQ